MDMGVDMDNEHCLLIPVCFEWSLGVLVISKDPTSCFDIKAKQSKHRIFTDSGETSFGSSFGYIETKLVS
jgi:hypothetical protein